ncbi:MAG: ATP-binding protein [Gammaproteobacteria bacterium]|nr:ATP-binding protein [Gammaproteobacteria bacterium]
MSRLRQCPLWVQITIALMIVCTLVVVATGEYVRHTEKAYLLKNIDENKTRVMEIIATTALESIITEDIPVLHTVVNQLTAANSDIAELRLENENGLILAGWKSNTIIDPTSIMSYSEKIVFQGEVFGALHIKWNLEQKLRDINQHIFNIYLINTLLLLLFTLLSILGVQRLVIIPIRDIEARLIDHSKGKQAAAGKYTSSREFVSLYDAVDKLRELTISKDELLNEIQHRKAIQQELAEARDKALSATETKSAFLANMSHEIRTPLTAIVGFSETLLDSDQSMSDRVESIQTIIRNGRHLQTLINDILDLSKIEAGKLELECMDIPLFGLLTDVHTLTRLQAEEKALYCKLDYHFPLPETIHTDPLRLKQVLINLCGNAVKFTWSGGIRIDVQYRQDSNRLVIRVIDTGVGMTPEQQKKIFNSFTQADSSVSRQFGGTGLGLHLSGILAEKLGGEIHVDSTPDVGSCFILTMDAGTQAAASLTNKEPAERSLETTQMSKLEGHILLAEDNIDNQRLIKMILQNLGLTCDIANNGYEAIHYAMYNSYDIILMDMQMPEMSGLEATQRLRESGYNGIITALTANATVEDREKCLAAGYNEFLTKPIDRKKFHAYFQNHLRASDKADELVNDTTPVISSLADDPVIGQLLPEYIKRLPEIAVDIQTTFREGNIDKLRMCAHNLKSTSGGYGYMQLYQLASRLEFEILKQDKAGMEKIIAAIVNMQERICKAI